MRMDERSVVARVERITLRELRLWVKEGWVRPARSDEGPVFDDIDVARIRLLCDLRRELELPTDAIPTVLTLIDHLHRARRDLRRMLDAVNKQPDEVRRSVLTSFQESTKAGGADHSD
jgi:chaperone modulatory protein CbpM